MLAWTLAERILAVLIALVTFWGVIYKTWLKKWLIKYTANRNQWRITLLEEMTQLKITVNDVKFQVFPNGGSSMLDKIGMILENQVNLKENQQAMIYLDSVAIIKFDMDGYCTFVNLSWLKLSGFNSPDEAHGVGWLRSVKQSERDAVRKEHIEAIKSKSLFTTSHTKVNLTTGKELKIRRNTKIIYNSKGVGVEVMGVVEEIN